MLKQELYAKRCLLESEFVPIQDIGGQAIIAAAFRLKFPRRESYPRRRFVIRQPRNNRQPFEDKLKKKRREHNQLH